MSLLRSPLSRRVLTLLSVLVIFTTALVLTSPHLDGICDNNYCDIAGLREKVQSFGSVGGANKHSAGESKTDDDHAAGQHRPPSSRPSSPLHSSNVQDDECAHFPKLRNVLVIVKTGASEAYARLPTQLLTNLKCVPHFVLFSDMSQTIGGYAVHDSLDNVLSEVKEKNKDFELYHEQKKCPVDQAQCNKENKDIANQGWNLDKYKNIHIAEKVYATRPDFDWYLFIDADTYVVYANLQKWLAELNPKKPHYIGSIAYLGDLPFGHGGSGYLMSKSAMDSMFAGKTGIANKYDEPVQHTCCGDAMWAEALKNETGIVPTHAWPTINGDKPHTFPYAEDQWCQPIVTMHHVNPEEISDIYAFEKERRFEHPLRARDLYHKFVGPHLVETRPDWENFSEDVIYLNSSAGHYEEWELNRAKTEDLSDKEREAPRSFDDCKAACLSLDNCFQFRYQNGICAMAHKFRHGMPSKKPEDSNDSKRFMSGWNVEKIKKWVEEHGDCKESIKWPVRDT